MRIIEQLFSIQRMMTLLFLFLIVNYAQAQETTLLESCWSPEQLHHTTKERIIHKRQPIDRTPPAQLFHHQPRQSLTPNFAQSIRAVTPANGEKLIALTFDLCEQAGEIAGYDGAIVDLLRAENVHATFYAGGQWMRSHPERTMQLMADSRFEIGNHAWTHGNLRVLRGQEINEQIEWTQAQYELLRAQLLARSCAKQLHNAAAVIPAAPATFRFPYGTCDTTALQQVAQAGLFPIQWNIVTGDPSKGQTAKQIVKAVFNQVRQGSIIVAHANGRGWHTYEAMKTLIPELNKRGYRFVTVSELLNSGERVVTKNCYEMRPGDNLRYDKLFGRGTQ